MASGRGRDRRSPWLAVLALLGALAASGGLWWALRDRGAAADAKPLKNASTAAAHLPAGCEALLRIDLRRALGVPGVRAKLEPALVEVSTAPPKSAPARALQAAGVDLARDVAELTVCLAGDDETRKFVFVITGDLRAESVVPAIASNDAPPPEVSSLDGRKLAIKNEPNGELTLVTQAEDGAVVIANDRAMLESAARKSDRSAEYGLAAEPEIAVAIGPALFRLLARPDGALAALSEVRQGRGSFSLTSARGALRLTPSDPSKAEAVAADVRRAVTELRALGPGRFGELAMLGAATARTEGAEVIVDLPWTAAGVEQLAQQVAAALTK
jgi:hypothetical protein